MLKEIVNKELKNEDIPTEHFMKLTLLSFFKKDSFLERLLVPEEPRIFIMKRIDQFTINANNSYLKLMSIVLNSDNPEKIFNFVRDRFDNKSLDITRFYKKLSNKEQQGIVTTMMFFKQTKTITMPKVLQKKIFNHLLENDPRCFFQINAKKIISDTLKEFPLESNGI